MKSVVSSTLVSSIVFAAVVGAFSTPAHADQFTGTVTADNHYALFTSSGGAFSYLGGNETGAAGSPGASNWSMAESYQFQLDQVLYIAAWSDNSTAQGVLAEFRTGLTSVIRSGDARWQVAGTGVNRGDGSAHPTAAQVAGYVAGRGHESGVGSAVRRERQRGAAVGHDRGHRPAGEVDVEERARGCRPDHGRTGVIGDAALPDGRARAGVDGAGGSRGSLVHETPAVAASTGRRARRGPRESGLSSLLCGSRAASTLLLMAPKPDKSLMRSLGEFFGHIARGIKTPVNAPPPPSPTRREVKREIEEETRETPTGKMTLRRTTIEEVVIHPSPDEDRKAGTDDNRRQE